MNWLLAGVLVSCAIGSGDAGATTCQLNQADFGKTRQQVRNCQGKKCGANTGHDCGPLGVEITPNPVRGNVGRPVRIRIDSTEMCNGQSVRELRGHIKWEAGSTCELTDTWGFVEHTYASAGDYTIEVEVTCKCYDEGGESSCVSKGATRVQIAP